nr:filamentous hemagglutinin N-terminal domain-containing protein [Roseateles depolymerans]
MNRLHFRIVFNKRRGQFMAAAETVRSRGKAPGESGAVAAVARVAPQGARCEAAVGGGGPPGPGLRLSVTALAVGGALGMALFVAEPLAARAEPSMATQSPGSGRGGARGDEASQARARVEQAMKQLQARLGAVRDGARNAAGNVAASADSRVIADPSAPGSQRPTVLTAPNGTTLVNIQTPSVAGVSRNTYSQFDVGATGVILNNSRTDTSTQLGGWVQGNPWLGRGEAQVILNEVNSSAPSQPHGYVEVAGRRAEVVIANPSGIQVDGGGFINASSATLTTGTP